MVELTPNKEMMQKQLEAIFQNATEGLVEIAYTSESSALNHAKLFDCGDIESIVDFAHSINSKDGHNVYFSPALRKVDTPKNVRAKDNDFHSTYCLFADFDDEGGLENAKKKYTEFQLEPPFGVITGKTPHPRGHIYYPLEEPVSDPTLMKELNTLLAEHLGGDPSITNPSRVMRLAGTIAYPKKKNRVPEMTEVFFPPNRRSTFEVIEIQNKFRKKQNTTVPPDTIKNRFTNRINIEKALEASRQNGAWHYNMRSAIAAMVGSGYDEDTIREMCAPYCEHGGHDPDLEPLINGAKQKFTPPAPHNGLEDTSEYVTAKSLSMVEVPERKWLIDEWIPEGTLTSLYGEGGTGKSLLIQQLAASVASGKKWCGLDINEGNNKVLGVFAEDDITELHRRQHFIEKNIDTGFLRTGMENLYLWSRVGLNNILCSFDQSGLPIENEFFTRLRQAIIDVQPRLLIVDTAADTFAGNENSRSEVNYFCKAILGSFCKEFGTTVILLAHPSLTGINTGSGLSGSTSWNNAVRSRLYLAKSKDNDVQRVLTRMKSNYASAGEDHKIDLFFHEGSLLVLEELPEDTRKQVDVDILKDRILDIISVAEAEGKPIKWGHSGAGLVSQLVKTLAAFYDEPIKKTRVKMVVEELIDDDEIGRYKDNHKNSWFARCSN